MALVLLGAIVAGAAGGRSGDAPMAVLAGGQGLLAQKSINFTRKDEIEADRVGIQTLANAGFDPNAMAGFFERMQDAMSAGAGGIDVPALLQTHPVTIARISDAKSRAGALISAKNSTVSIPPRTAMVMRWHSPAAVAGHRQSDSCNHCCSPTRKT
jgi:predicted Zn-dependent protease